MTLDVIIGWLKCAGYGVGLLGAIGVLIEHYNKCAEKHRAEIKDCRNCTNCTLIRKNGSVECKKLGWFMDLPLKCNDFVAEGAERHNDNSPKVVSRIVRSVDGDAVQILEVHGSDMV